MSESLSTEDVLDVMTSRFMSANEIPVERAQITRTEWLALLNEVEDALYENHDPTRKDCGYCRLLAAVSNAREMLT